MTTERLHPEGLLGRKIGMTQIFTEQGECVPVTVIQTGPCYVLEVKNKETHGYAAVQLGFGPKKAQRVTKPQMGHFGKAGKGAFYHVKELRCDAAALGWTTPGQELLVNQVFGEGELVDVTGISKGRGFEGVIKRYHMKGQPATRGTHEMRRNIGSVGCRKTPGRIIPNKRMPGRMGDETVTTQNLQVMGVMPDENLLLLKGAVPGHKGALVVVKKAIKSYAKKQAA